MNCCIILYRLPEHVKMYLLLIFYKVCLLEQVLLMNGCSFFNFEGLLLDNKYLLIRDDIHDVSGNASLFRVQKNCFQ